MIISYSTDENLFIATKSYDYINKLKAANWRFQPKCDGRNARWATSSINSVRPLEEFLNKKAKKQFLKISNSEQNTVNMPIVPKTPGPTDIQTKLVGKPSTNYTPTDEQLAANANAIRLRNSEISSLKLIAAAGAGKTSTLNHIAQNALKEKSIFYLAFAKKNAEEAKMKMPKNVSCSTLHSAAWQALNLKIPFTKLPQMHRFILNILNSHNFRWLLENEAGGRNATWQASIVAKVISRFCMSDSSSIETTHVSEVLNESIGGSIAALKRKQREETNPTLKIACNNIDESIANLKSVQNDLTPIILNAALQVWPNLQQNMVSYHDVYLKYFQLNKKLVKTFFDKYDCLMIDEAQDLNPVQIAIIRQADKPTIAVGDSFQQLYAFRGALDALELIEGEVSNLSQSFRFGDNIAEIARNILKTHPTKKPDIPVRGSHAINSSVHLLSSNCPDLAQGNPLAILCRTNAGALQEALWASQYGRVCVVGGIKSIIDELNAAIALKEGRRNDIPLSSPLSRLIDWNDLLIQAEAGDIELEKIIDLVENADDIKLLMAMHDDKPNDETVAICSTTHKAKGLEWDRVYISTDFPSLDSLNYRYNDARESESDGAVNAVRQAIESWHVLYVAVTRARKTLILPQKQKDLLSNKFEISVEEERHRQDALNSLDEQAIPW